MNRREKFIAVGDATWLLEIACERLGLPESGWQPTINKTKDLLLQQKDADEAIGLIFDLHNMLHEINPTLDNPIVRSAILEGLRRLLSVADAVPGKGIWEDDFERARRQAQCSPALAWDSILRLRELVF